MKITLQVDRTASRVRLAERFTHLRYRTERGRVHFVELWVFGRVFLVTALIGDVDESRDALLPWAV